MNRHKRNTPKPFLDNQEKLKQYITSFWTLYKIEQPIYDGLTRREAAIILDLARRRLDKLQGKRIVKRKPRYRTTIKQKTMKYLFFDTETTGKPKNYKGDIKDLDNWPRIIQLAWILCDDTGKELSSRCNLILPDGWEIPNEKFWIDNGYSTEKSLKEGHAIAQELNEFKEAIDQCDVMIAHNLSFDVPVVSAEMLRAGVKANKRPGKFCTMLNTTNICKLEGPYGYKWPKLEELHTFLFGESFDGAHDALEDVRATMRCFLELKKRELITL